MSYSAIVNKILINITIALNDTVKRYNFNKGVFMQKEGLNEDKKEFFNTFCWEIDPLDRAWYINNNGLIKSGASHFLILKNTYNDEWNNLKQKGMEEADIARTLENRLIKTGTVKIGELDNFYVVVNSLDSNEENIIKGFVKSILNVRSCLLNSKIIINQLVTGNAIETFFKDY
jgi:hypothetical protein